MLLVNDQTGIIFDSSSGNPTRKQISWSDQPTVVACVKPFVVSLLPKRVEVHSLGTHRLVQVREILYSV